MYNFLFVITELVSLALRRYRRKSVEGGGSLRSPILGGRGRRPPTTVGWQKTRWIALSCGIKISPVGSLDYSQSTRVTGGQTDRRTEGQNYDSQDRASIAASRGKKCKPWLLVKHS